MATILESIYDKCVMCGDGELVIDTTRMENKEEIVIYGRNGTYMAQHIEKRCNKRNCRASYFHGYHKHNGKKIFQKDALKNKILITSNQTGFEVQYLYEVALDIALSNSNFESISAKYNNLHFTNLPYDVLWRRQDLFGKRLSEAYFLYIYLDLGQRYCISNYHVLKGTVDEAILEHKVRMMLEFRERWCLRHECDVKGCGEAIIIDGGLKPHRPICQAKLNGVRKFKLAGVSTLTGCTAIPLPGEKYCKQHVGAESPVIPASAVCDSTKQSLRTHRKQVSSYEEERHDSVFIIESIMDIRTKNGEKELLVKWLNFPTEKSTWEPECNIPQFIVKYYSDPYKLGQKLPDPQIKHTKTIGGVDYHFLQWGGETTGNWHDEDFFKIVSEDGELSSTIHVSCNTRKSRDKRERRHTVGILVGAFPCGMIVLWDEIYGSESISQVYGIMIEFFGNLSNIENIKEILYDDCCHLKKFAENEERAKMNDITSYFAKMSKHVDKFHFKNHVDIWCQKNCNPYDVKNLEGVNTPICEQLFKKINLHTNVKSMNEPHFFMFFLFNFDFHNLQIEKRVRSTINPKSEHRWDQISDVETKINENDDEKLHSDGIESLVQGLTHVEIKESTTFECDICSKVYKTSSNFTKHMQTKHESQSEVFQCQICSKFLASKQALQRHMVKCQARSFMCSICQDTFSSEDEMKVHKKIHTTCSICGKDMRFASKLTRHMKVHNN